MTTVDPNRTIAGIEPGHHLCWLYQSQQEHRALLTPFLRRGLAQGERVIYVVDAHPAEAVLGYLRDDGLEPSPYLASGQLSILTADEAYLRDGAFDPDAMVALLRAETDRALADGYAALRVTGEMTWVLRGLPGSEALIEYESKLNEFFPGSKCLALCQYDRRRFEPGVLLDVLTTHRVAVVGTELFDNFYYVPPGELLGSDRLSATLRRQLDNLAERKRTAETLRRQREEQQIILDSVPAMIFHKDQENRLIRVNRAFAEAAGKARADMEGRTLFELYPDLADDCWRDDKEVMESGQPKRNIVQPIETPAGLRWLQTDKIPYRDANGNTIGVIGFALDITERKRAEEALRESEERNRDLVERVRDVVWRLDSEGRFTFVNPAIRSMLGHEPAELIGAPFETVLTEEGRLVAKEALRKRLAGELPDEGIALELVHRHKDGSELVGEIQSSPIFGAGGELVGIAGTTRDVTERKRAEEALRLERDNLKRTFAAMADGVYIVDQEHDIQYVNHVLQKDFGPCEGRKCFEYLGDRTEPCPWCKNDQVFAGETVRWEWYSFKNEKTYDLVDTPLRNPDGSISRLEIFRDITERKRAEEEVSNLARFPSENPNPVFRIAEDGAVLYANAAAESLLSSRGSGTGRGAPDEWRKLGAEALASGSRSGTEVDHGSRVVSFELAPVTDAGYVNWYGRDITERKRAEEAAKRAQQQLLEQQRGEMERVEAELAKVRDELVRTTRLAAIGQVTASIAHELRNPLGSVRNAAYYLKRHLLKHEPGAAEYLGIIEQEVSAANLIITNLLAMARAREPTKQAVDLGQVVREAFAAIKGAEGVHCRVSLDPAPFLVQADPHQLQQILENLLKNAVQAMEGRGEVLVDATRNPDHDTILVRDSGPGVAAEVRESLFEPLVTTKPSGTGLGLAICRQIAAKHGGTVDLAAHEGAGAAFRVRLPRH